MPAQKTDKRKKASRARIRVVKSSAAVLNGATAKTRRRRVSKPVTKKAPQRASVSNAEKTVARSRRSARTEKKERKVSVAGAETLAWSDLIETENNLILPKEEGSTFLGAISTIRFALGVLAIASIFTLYVGHVYATQDLLTELQEDRRENLSLQLEYNRTKGLYEAATGPAIIYERAHALGLEERAVLGPPIRITRE